MTTVPISITTLRSAIDAVEEKADLIWVVSAVSRETTSPGPLGLVESRG